MFQCQRQELRGHSLLRHTENTSFPFTISQHQTLFKTDTCSCQLQTGIPVWTLDYVSDQLEPHTVKLDGWMDLHQDLGLSQTSVSAHGLQTLLLARIHCIG
jgi:hypothetical protein